MILKICRYCGKKYDYDKGHECPKKLNRRRQNEKHHREVTKEANAPLHTVRWRSLRKDIIRADGGVCQRCLIKFHILNDKQLEPHHIIPRVERPDLAFDTNNIVTVCKSCNLELGLSGIDFDWSPENRNLETGVYSLGEEID